MKYQSPLIAAGSGKLAGMVASHNAGGQYLRAYRIPVNPSTSQQTAIRNALSLLQTRFANTLSNAQRAAWQVFAFNVSVVDALGARIYISGQQWYVKANVPRLQAAIAAVDAGPTVWELAALTTPVPTITAAGTTVSVAFTAADAWANEAGGYLLVYASRPQNNTKNFFAGPYQLAGKVTGAASPPASPAVITLPFTSGPSGSRQFFRFVATRADGRPSPTFRVTGTV